jgi:hypothetical protein
MNKLPKELEWNLPDKRLIKLGIQSIAIEGELRYSIYRNGDWKITRIVNVTNVISSGKSGRPEHAKARINEIRRLFFNSIN